MGFNSGFKGLTCPSVNCGFQTAVFMKPAATQRIFVDKSRTELIRVGLKKSNNRDDVRIT